MKLIGRMARILPVILLPALYNYNRIWMTEGQAVKDQIQQSLMNNQQPHAHSLEQQIATQKQQNKSKHEQNENKQSSLQQPLPQKDEQVSSHKDIQNSQPKDKQDKQIPHELILIQTQSIKDNMIGQVSIEVKEQPSKQIKDNQSTPTTTTTTTTTTITVEPSQAKIVDVGQLIKKLNANQAIISQSCPPHIQQYLKQLNLQIITTKQPTSNIIIQNKKHQLQTFNLTEIAQLQKDEMQLLSNFINPPEEIYSLADIHHKLKHIPQDQFLIYTYIPLQADYEAEVAPQMTPFNSFTASRKVDIEQLERSFIKFANNSSSNKNTYFIVRTKEAADYLKINQSHIGVPYILNKTSKESGNQSNTQRLGQRLYIRNLSHKARIEKEELNRMSHLYINKIETEGQMLIKIRQMQMSGDKRKVLLFYTKEQKSQFHEQVEKILEQVSRIQKQNVIVIKTNNESILKHVFKVQPDKFTTVRLFDLHSQQPPLFSHPNQQSNHQIFYKRSKLKGPFNIPNLCEFIKKQGPQQHNQSKHSLTFLKTASPSELKSLNNTLLLLQKEKCKGCEYMQQTLDELKKIIHSLRHNPKMRKHLIYQYKIEDPKSLEETKIRRYNIFNEDANFMPPSVTPQLYYLNNGKYIDLKASEILKAFQNAKNNTQDHNVHDVILSEIINKIRLSQRSDLFEQF